MASVWAPAATMVKLIAGDSVWEMIQDKDGWWYSDYALQHCEKYAFELDSHSTLPDPRSPWQPQGVHEFSRHVDHEQFAWTDQHWQACPISAAIIYELHIGTFTKTGTFDAAISRLEHLKQLGVTHVEVMPIAQFEGEHGWGYDGVALYAPHHAYGGPLGFKRFVDACHQHGLAVILDVVYNHLGPVGNYLPKYGPYFTDRYQTPWGTAVNFDGPDSYEVRKYFCDNALMWLRDYHCDALRLDAVHSLVDHSAIHILEQLATEVNDLQSHLGKHFVLIAESDLNDSRVIRPWEMGGFGINAQWSDDIHHSLHTILTGETNGYYCDFGTIVDLANAMQKPFVYQGRYSQFRRRMHGRHLETISPHRFVAYLQNHDQLGNRSQGERLCHLVNQDRVKIGAALLLTAPYIPLLFQGEEWGSRSPFKYFVDFHREPELAKAVAEGRQKEFSAFGWSADAVANPTELKSFTDSILNWDELLQEEHADLMDWHRQLIQLRSRYSALTTGRIDATSVLYDERAQWILIHRGTICIACNLQQHEVTVPFEGVDQCTILMTSKLPTLQDKSLILPPESVTILETSRIAVREFAMPLNVEAMNRLTQLQ